MRNLEFLDAPHLMLRVFLHKPIVLSRSGYNYGSAKLELKTKTANGLAVTAGGSSNLASGKISGNLETKWACKEQGLTGERSLSAVSSLPSVLTQ